MPKIYKISEEQLSEIQSARRKNTNKFKEKRLRVLVLHAEGTPRAEISKITEFNECHISKLVSLYFAKGLSAIVGNNIKGNRRNLGFEEEAALLAPFKAAAEKGNVVDINAIRDEYAKLIGRDMDNDKSQIYRVLARHGWRKVMPRSKHPNKASDEEIESSKKNSTQSSKSHKKWQIPRQ